MPLSSFTIQKLNRSYYKSSSSGTDPQTESWRGGERVLRCVGIVAAAVGWISETSEMGVSAAERQYRKKSLAHKKAPAV